MSVAPSGPLFLGLDVGGTNIKAGCVGPAGEVLGRGAVPTGQADGCAIGLDRIEAAARAALQDAGAELQDVAAVGLATPGPMDLKTGTLLCPSNLPGWRDWPVRDAVAGRFGKPTVLQNDANAAAYGEYWSGAGRDADSLVLWTLGTGIGCGIILRDLVIEGEHSHGSECGHIIVDSSPDARRHPGTGQRGTLEAYCGARGVIARTEEALNSGRPSSLQERVAAGAAVTPKLVCEAAAGGDELATEILVDTARWLGVGTVSVLHTIDPDAVLLAGAMTFGGPGTATGELFLETLRAEVRDRAFPTVAEHLDVTFAKLGGDAGVVGAAGCARRAFGGPGVNLEAAGEPGFARGASAGYRHDAGPARPDPFPRLTDETD